MIETLSFRLNCFSVNDYVTDLNNLEISPLLTPVCVRTIFVWKKTGVIYPGGDPLVRRGDLMTISHVDAVFKQLILDVDCVPHVSMGTSDFG